MVAHGLLVIVRENVRSMATRAPVATFAQVDGLFIIWPPLGLMVFVLSGFQKICSPLISISLKGQETHKIILSKNAKGSRIFGRLNVCSHS